MKENAIYSAIVGYCEGLEHDKIYRGNGHHLAQRLTALIRPALLSKQQKKIYDVLSETPMTTKEISEKVNINTSLVAAILTRIKKESLLINSDNLNQRRKVWWITKNY